jgi:apolipoprotein N-acyltransferase
MSSIRCCPICMAVVPAGKVVAHSNDLVCDGCGKPLEIASGSRNLAVVVGLVAGAISWWLGAHSAQSGSALGWTLPVVYAVLVFGAVTPAVLMLSADLRISDVSAVPQGAVAVLPGVHGSHN